MQTSTSTKPSKILPKTFRAFYLSLTRDEKCLFKEKFLEETKLKAPTFDHYKKEDGVKKIPFQASQTIYKLAEELHPDKIHFLLEQEEQKGIEGLEEKEE